MFFFKQSRRLLPFVLAAFLPLFVVYCQAGENGQKNGYHSDRHPGEGHGDFSKRAIAHLDVPIMFFEIGKMSGMGSNSSNDNNNGLWGRLRGSIIQKWWHPHSIQEFESLFIDGTKIQLPDEDVFLAGIRDRIRHEKLKLLAKSHFQYNDDEYIFIKYLVLKKKKGTIRKSGVLVLKNSEPFWKISSIFNDLVPWHQMFWRCNVEVLKYLVFGEDGILRKIKLTSALEETLRTFRLENSNENGELLILNLSESMKTLSTTNPALADIVFVKPSGPVPTHGVDLSEQEKQKLQKALEEIGIDEKSTNIIVATIENKGALAGVVKLKGIKEMPTPEAVELIQGIIGDDHLTVHDSRDQ